jgi:uncharacterized membrane protein (UPF0127 family)
MTRLLLLTCALLAQMAALGDEDLDRLFDRDTLIIEASEHACYRFDIYVAISDAQRSRGLMFVREMPQTTGMLFVYPGERRASMWMKNTYLPLDMVFARADGTVINVIRDTEPQSLKSLASTEPAVFVLELNAGVTARLHIDEHSRLFWTPAHAGID